MAASRILSVHRRGAEPEVHLFIDETRTQDRFCLTGCVISREAHHDQIHGRFEAMKTNFFPKQHAATNPIVFRRREIANGEPPFAFCAAQQQQDFHKQLFDTLYKAEFKAIVAIATYNKSLERGDRAADAYRRCLNFLLFRYVGYLYHQHARGDVYAEHVGRNEDGFLKHEYLRTRNYDGAGGEDSAYFRHVLTSKDLHVEDKSKNVGGLQVADLLAAPLMRKFLSLGLRKQFDLLMAEVGESKLNRRFCDGTVDGYGLRIL
jgi:Protein of unknown function (DUF3800)